MSNYDVRSVYRGIIDDVVTNCRPEFVQEGVDEAVLDELRILWEEKLQQTGVLAAAPTRPATAPGLHYPTPARGGVQYVPSYYSQVGAGGSAQLGRPSFQAPQSAVPWQQPQSGVPMGDLHLGGQYRQQLGSQLPGSFAAASQPVSAPQLAGRQTYPQQPQQYAAPSTLVQSGQPLIHTANALQYGSNSQVVAPTTVHKPNPEALLAYLQQISGQAPPAAGGRQAANPLPQHYAATLQAIKNEAVSNQLHQTRTYQSRSAESHPSTSYGQAGSQPIRPVPTHWQQYAAANQQQGYPQVQGAPAPDLAGQKRRAEYDQANGRAKQPHQGQGGIVQLDGSNNNKDEDEAAGEGEDKEEEVEDKLSDVPSSNEADEDVPNQCLSQFTKVQRTKNRWKCQLLAGVLNLNGRDHVFNQASGEFQF